MKLKKIASLMLAGVMAISMLAGCSGEKETEENNQVAPTTNIATYANSLLSASQKAVFEFKSSTELDEALKAVATDSTKFTSKDIKDNANNVTGWTWNEKLKTELEKKLDVDFEAGLYFQSSAANGKDKYNAYVCVLSTVYDENGAVKTAVDEIKSNALNGSAYFPATKGDYTLDYTAEISAVKVTAPDNSKDSVWVVAFLYTQSATEAANV